MKRKFLSLILILAIALSCISLPAFAQSYNLAQEVVSLDYSGTTLSVTCKITKIGSSASSANGYAAVYSADGVLKSAATKKVAIPDTVTYDIENYICALGDYVRVFLWDDNHAPVASGVQSEVSLGDTIQGVILETYISSAYYSKGDNTVSVLVTESDSENYTEGEIYEFIADSTNAANYLGFSVTAKVAGSIMLECNATDDINSLLVLSADSIVNIDTSGITYYETSSSKYTTEAEITPSIIAGNTETDISDYYIVLNGLNKDYDYTFDFFSFADDLDEIVLLDNNGDGTYEFIFAALPTDVFCEFVVESVSVENGIYTLNGKSYSLELDYESGDSYITVVKDGIAVTPDAITKGDIITCLDASVPVLTVYVSSLRVEGTVDEIDGDLHTINEVDYKISPLSDIDDIDVGTSGIFYLNAFGKIAYIALPPLDYQYFYLTDTAIKENGFTGTSYLLRGITSSGKEETYTINNSNVDIYTPDGNAIKVTAKAAYRYFEGYNGVLKIALNDNSRLITAVFPDAADDFMTNDSYDDDAEHKISSYNENRLTYGYIKLDSDTVIFSIDTTDGTVSASSVGKAFTHGSCYSFISYGAEDEAAPVLVVYDIALPGDDHEQEISESEYVYLIDYSYTNDAFGDTEYYVQMMTSDGAVDPYIINSMNVSIYTKDGAASSLSAAEAYNAVSSYTGVAKAAFTEDDSIAEFYLPGCEEFSENTAYKNTSAVYDRDSFTLGEVSIDEKTLLFNIDSTEDDLDAALSAYKAYNVLEDGAFYYFTCYGKEDEAVDVIVTYDLKLAFNAEENVMVATKVADAIVNGAGVVKITGVMNDTLFSVYVTQAEYERAKIAVGNVFLYTLENGFATDLQLLFTSTDEAPGELSENLKGIITDDFSDKYVTIHYGEITDKTTYTVTIDEDKFYFADEVNVIVVDYTGAKTSISSGTLSDIKTSNAKYVRTAFVKTVSDTEDEISDIVVFVEAV